MRWLPFAILVYVILGLHLALRPYIAWRDATPNLVLLAAVFVAINAPREPALLGCFVLGVLQDLFTQQPMGVHALVYGLVGLVMVANQQVVYREHPLTHLAMALFGGVAAAALTVALSWANQKLHADTSELQPVAESFGTDLLGALYTAALAPVVVGLLQRCRRVFGFRTRQATMAFRT